MLKSSRCKLIFCTILIAMTKFGNSAETFYLKG
jgi:hypothetical protein